MRSSASFQRFRRRPDVLLLVAIVALELGLSVAWSLRKGLVLDEFHSLFHARASDGPGFFENLRRDNHAPAFFLMLGAVRRAAGESALALRALSLAFGAGTVVLVWHLGRRLGGVATAAVAATLLAVSSLHLEFASQARMYALHGLCFAGFLAAAVAIVDGCEASIDERERSLGASLIALFWAALGLHVHYFFLHYLVLATLGLFIGALIERPPNLGTCARRLGGVLLAAAVLASPWYLWGFRAQLEHGLSPGMTAVSFARVGEALIHLLYLNVRAGGPALRPVFIGCGILAIALAVWGACAGAPRRDLAFRGALIAAAFGVPAWAGVLASFRARLGFNWSYVLPSACAFALLIARAWQPGAFVRVRRAAIGLVAAAALSLSVLNVRAGGTEDYRGAIAAICSNARAGDAVIPVEWQPGVFDQGLAWDYYAPRMQAAGLPLPARLAVNATWELDDPRLLEPYARVFVLARSLRPSAPLLEMLRARYESEDVREWGYGLRVHHFSRPRS